MLAADSRGQILPSASFVMFHGEIQGEVRDEEMTEQKMMHLATGGDSWLAEGVEKHEV
jgi:hypothetical protein